MAVSKVDAANQIENQLPQANIAGNVNFRNIIINGDMSIAQRGTSETGITGTGYYTVDRFQFVNNNQGTWTMSQDTDVPSGQGFSKSLKLDCTVADASPAAGDYLQYNYKIEGQNLQYLKKGTSSAESLTLSFWVKSNKTGTYIAEFFDNDNTRANSQSYTINSSNTWEKKTITIPGDTTGAFDNDNNASLFLVLWLGGGTDFTSGTLNTSWNSRVNANAAVGQVNLADDTANEWYITGVQLEAGTTASDFEFLPVDVNLKRCQRYFEKSFPITTAVANNVTHNAGYMAGIALSTTDLRPSAVYYQTEKRATATITYYSSNIGTPENGKWVRYVGNWNTCTMSTDQNGTRGFSAIAGTSSVSAAGVYIVAGHWTASAEL